MTTVALLIALACAASAQGKGAGGGGGAPAPAGGGSATAESEVRMYRAISAVTNDIASQLLNGASAEDAKQLRLNKVIILYDSRTVSDMVMEQTFRAPLDALVYQLKGKTIVRPVNPKLPAAPMSFTGISLSGILSTLTSAAAISTAWTTVTSSVAGVTGTTDADAFMAAELMRDLKDQGDKFPVKVAMQLYAPSLFPLVPTIDGPLKSIYIDRANESDADLWAGAPSQLDPLTELFVLQEQALKHLRNDQTDLSTKASTLFAAALPPQLTAVPPTGQQPDPATTYFNSLVADLKAAISWAPPVTIGASSLPSGGGGGGGGQPAAPPAGSSLPLAMARADAIALKASLKDKTTAFYKAVDDLANAMTLPTGNLTPDNDGAAYLDMHIQIIQALGQVAAGLNAAIPAYGTATSAAPALGAPDTLANMVTRGWQVRMLLNDPLSHAKLLRLHLEMSQGSTLTASWQWQYRYDASAMAEVSYILFGAGGSMERSGASMAYYGFEPAGESLNDRKLTVVRGAPPLSPGK